MSTIIINRVVSKKQMRLKQYGYALSGRSVGPWSCMPELLGRADMGRRLCYDFQIIKLIDQTVLRFRLTVGFLRVWAARPIFGMSAVLRGFVGAIQTICPQ
jgi:hypothetical protein